MAVLTAWKIVHRCGHEVTHDLSNRPADRRAGFARWLEGRDCTDCWKAARDSDTESKEAWLAAKRAEEQQAAREWAEQFDMPPLEGPEKALAWGERSRHQLVTAAYSALVSEGTWDSSRRRGKRGESMALPSRSMWGNAGGGTRGTGADTQEAHANRAPLPHGGPWGELGLRDT